MPARSIYSKRLGKMVADYASRNTPARYHVIRTPDAKWSVVQGGRTRSMRTFYTKRQAMAFARKYLKSRPDSTMLIVHNTEGGIDERVSF
jgi:hypothetical protein